MSANVLNLPIVENPYWPDLPEPWASVLRQQAETNRILTETIALLTGRAPGSAPVGRVPRPMLVAELVSEFLLCKSRAGRSVTYLETLRMSLAHFARLYGKRPAEGIDAQMIERWLSRRKWSLRSKRNRLLEIRTLLAWAVKRGYVPQNAAATVELPEPEPEPIGIHTPDQVKAVLSSAGGIDPTVCRILALRYFAGLRSAESLRLREADIRREAGVVEVPAAKSKTRQRRLVTIQPALATWLDWTSARGGELPLRDEWRRQQKAVAPASVPWSHNVTRHSFCSYHLAGFQSAAVTALEAGHSEAMLFHHYRALVLPADAKAFWAIRPV